MTTDFALERGDGALVISAPHVGLELPPEIAARLQPVAQALPDTDWYADRLYPFARALDATVLRATWSRYVVDLNRDPAGTPLYPGARTTGFVPRETFAGQPLYASGDEPDNAESEARRARYFAPYHATLEGELARVRARHGWVLLIDAHSIWGNLPLLFEGELPAVNLGTNDGRSCDQALRRAAYDAVAASPYAVVVDGRFKGGYITRRYGAPEAGVHALQIEINQRTYLADGSRTEWDEPKAAQLSATLETLCRTLLAHAPALR